MQTRANKPAALSDLRICDLTTGFSGPSATRWLAAFGAEVIKVEDLNNPDPTRDIHPSGWHFNNLNVGKLGMALDMGGSRGRQLVVELAAISDVICVNYPGLGTIGIDIESITSLRTADEESELIVAVGPEDDHRDPMLWLGLGTAILKAVYRQRQTGRGGTVLSPWIDPEHQPDDRPSPYTCADDQVAIDCRDDGDRAALGVVMGSEEDIALWCKSRSRWTIEAELRSVGVPVAALQLPDERVDGDIATGARHLWPMVDHPELGGTRVEGLAVEMSKTSWSIAEPAPLLGQDTRWVLSQLLDRSEYDLDRLQRLSVIT